MIKETFFHEEYSVTFGDDWNSCLYDRGAIEKIALNFPEIIDKSPYSVTVTVTYRSGEQHCWETKYLEVSYIRQFGLAVTADGNCVFIQTWENGLYCLDARTGAKRWRTKSRRGVTNAFVGKDYILCQQHNRALQLLDIQNGEVLSERRVTSWGFTSLNHRYIACEARVARWEIIEAATLKTVQSYSAREFTQGHEYYCVNLIQYRGNGMLRVSGFLNRQDGLPNDEFTALVSCPAMESPAVEG